MKIYYQGVPGAYSYNASMIVDKNLNIKNNKIIGLETFDEIWDEIGKDSIAVLPIENSYAGSIHQNLYNFLKYNFTIYGEILIEVNHCLLSKEKNIKNIKSVYSHPQALAQCHKFLQKNKMKPIEYLDTAMSAKMLGKSDEKGIGAIASLEAGEMYGLNVIKKGIQDQKGNTTRFFVVGEKNAKLNYKEKKNKSTIIFSVKHIPGALYKSIGCFATNGINLTKIESLPSYQDPFTYIFWIDIQGTIQDKNVKNALKELEFYAKNIKFLGEY